MFDVIAIGDATFDIFNLIHEAHVRSDERARTSLLEVTYRDKIPVDQCAIALGGNATNTVVGLSRLGLSCTLYAVRGDDCFGAFIATQLDKERIDTRYMEVEPNGQSNVSTILVFKKERTIFPYYVPRTYRLPSFAPSRWVYLSGGGKGFEKLYSPIRMFVKEHGSTLAFNPGAYQLRHNLSEIIELLPSVDVLFVNKEEGEMILTDHHKGMGAVAQALKAMGPAIVVVTDDVRGAAAVSGTEMLHIACFEGDVVEKTGAGDAFTAGFLAGFMRKQSLGEGLRAGAVNAASVVRYIGAQEGLLTKTKLEKLLSEHPDFTAKKL